MISANAQHARKWRRSQAAVAFLFLLTLVLLSHHQLTAAYKQFAFNRKRAAFIAAVDDLPHRPIDGRLTTGFEYRPVFRAARDAEDAPALKRSHMVGTARAFRLSLTTSSSAFETARGSATANLVAGDVDAAIANLEEGLRSTATGLPLADEAQLRSDLAAAYLSRARSLRRPADTIAALDSADRAWRLAPKSVEILWNRALAIESTGLLRESRDAWRAYLDADANSAWSAEARQRLAAVSAESSADRWNRALQAFEHALTDGDANVVRQVARRFPVRVKERIERQWILRWAESVPTDRAEAERVLLSMTTAAEAIADTSGDRTLLEFVARARTASSISTFAAPHARIAAVRTALRERGTDAAVAELETVIADLRRVRSPIAVVAAVELGGWHFNRGRHEEALRVLDEVSDEIAARPWPLTAAKKAWNCGVALTSLGYVTRAAESYERAIEIYRAAGDPTHIGMLTSLLAANAHLANDVSEEWRRNLEGLRLAERHGDPDYVLSILNGFVRTAVRHEQFGVARVFNDALIARSGHRDKTPYLCHALITRCDLEMRLGSRSSAAAQCVAARQTWSGIVDEATRNRLGADLEVATAATVDGPQRIEGLTRAVDLSTALHDLYRLSRVHLLRARAYVAQGSVLLARADLERGLEVIEEQRQRLERIPDRVSYMETSRGIAEELVRLLVRSGSPDAALEVVERVRARALTEHLVRTRDVTPLDGRAIARQLGAGDAVIEYWTDEQELFSWVLRRDRVTFTRHPVPRAQLGDLVQRFGGSIARGEAVDDTAASALYRHLLAPLEAALVGVTRVTIIADDATAAIPFAALRDARGTYMLERFLLAGAPSATAFAASQALSLTRHSSVLVLADPETQMPLAPLDVRSEIAATRKLRTVTVYEDRHATVEILKSSAARYDVIHIAAHGFEDRHSGEPALAFTPDAAHIDGLLVAPEAESLTLRRGALVVLAACRSASGRGSFEGPRSLGRAFLGAGAGSVVAALWDVEDAASGALFADFYEQMAHGLSPPAALRIAQLEALKKPGTHPRFWAAFQLYGGQ